jgi:hypothetical protein
VATLPSPGGRSIAHRSDIHRSRLEAYVRVPGLEDRQLSFEGLNGWPRSRFISHDTVAGFDEDDPTLSVVKLDGTIKFSFSLQWSWRPTEVATSTSGRRFSFHEGGYRQLNSFINFYRY